MKRSSIAGLVLAGSAAVAAPIALAAPAEAASTWTVCSSPDSKINLYTNTGKTLKPDGACAKLSDTSGGVRTSTGSMRFYVFGAKYDCNSTHQFARPAVRNLDYVVVVTYKKTGCKN